MSKNSINAYDLPARVASYDADLKDVSVFWLEYREVVYGGRKTT